MEYDLGETVELYIEDIRDTDTGELTDPFALDLTIVRPDGVQITKAIGDLAHVSTGNYVYRFVPTTSIESGDWAYRFVHSNPAGAGEGTFTVRRSIVLGGPEPSPYQAGVAAPWAELGDLPTSCQQYEDDPGDLESWLQVASDVLYDLTGRKWPGETADTIRPCGRGLFGWCGCHDSRTCGCRRVSEYRLPGYPVRSIVQVKINGEALDSARYRLDDRRWLVYLPESDSALRRGWPCCQRMDRADSEDDTWSISYTWGANPPEAGRRMAALYACQLHLGASGDKSCQLPTNASSISRQGVTVVKRDPTLLVQAGGVGLAVVDAWIASVVRGDRQAEGRMWIPGLDTPERRTR